MISLFLLLPPPTLHNDPIMHQSKFLSPYNNRQQEPILSLNVEEYLILVSQALHAHENTHINILISLKIP